MEKRKIAVIGLGYVGLPLARLFSTKFSTIGFDINTERVAELNLGKDSTCELSQELLQKAIKEGFRCTSMQEDIAESNFYVIAVPTPVDKEKRPDFKALFSATELVAKVLKKGDIVVYESTVYPGVTEEKCVPILQKISGLEYNKEFFVGYSPERINPGDKQHTVEKIKKVVSASNSVALKEVERVYTSVIEAGVHLVGSIKVAEAAKVIENSQRDINIAFVNELAKIFALVGIDTTEVLEAASTKWNFLPFKPGLVGGHCIGVDPYYLAECAERYGYNPQVILSGRRINDSMGEYVAMRVIKLMLNSGIEILHSKVLILGFTFKENCTDIRNTKVYDIYKTLREYEIEVDIYDSWADRQEVSKEYGISLDNILLFKDLESFNNEKIEQKESERVLEGDRFFEGKRVEGERVLSKEKYDGVILAVAHKDFLNINIDNLVKDKHIVFDIKSLLPQSKTYRL
ncbi:MAG: nucleotide sugar dehydrogenase [Bacteroidota bacterium]|nr:nucleotide sugar dehydrogenase [Bacteroidota bacterium]